jgi:hypothetical protein
MTDVGWNGMDGDYDGDGATKPFAFASFVAMACKIEK